MAVIKPFRAYRPKNGLEAEIAALPYDVYNREEATTVVQGKPLSFLNIDRAETQFEATVDTYDDRVYQKAHDLLWGMIEQGQFVQEDKSVYYIYELTMNGRVQTGIVACASVDDYQNQVIKKHENTRADKELDRIRHVDTCNAQTGPIFLAYRANAVLREILGRTKQNPALYDFTSDDGITHRVWCISDDADVATIQNTFAGIEQIYIADGHHRCASAVKVGLKKREENPAYTGEEEFNFFLSVLFADEELMIMDYNRVVKDLNGLSEEEFMQKIQDVFYIAEQGDVCHKPEKKGQISMLLGNTWYLLEVKEEYQNDDPVDGLDVAILQNHCLAPMLGIEDPKTDKRIDFIGGIRGIEELERRVNSDCKVAFAMYPTSIHELFGVADANRLMPPKSTWFEPKLRSGLFIHALL
ncbi:MAG: DUF1015 domain-containing protein [Alphaproteobacteria bacterium]|nr:DUF1015 domain-containing protein [Alphaproteobacteria bacterium]MBQ6996106.1 DUF1015 domain-containing protein [Lachnospiraceae bacterium]